MSAFVNIRTLEENTLMEWISRMLPKMFYMHQEGKNNVYIYNEVFYDDLTAQQVNNEINLSIGLLNADILSTGDLTDELDPDGHKTGRILMKTPLHKTFEFHIWSCNLSNIETLHYAELVRRCVIAHPSNIKPGSKIEMYYLTLDNTNKPLNDCCFSSTFLTTDIYALERDQIESVTLQHKYLF